MSAFVVGEDHIHALVTLAVRGPSGGEINPGNAWTRLRWDRHPELGWRDDGKWGRAEHEDADRIGGMLWYENVASVEGRYPDTAETGEYPGGVDFSVADVLLYSWPFGSPRLTAVQGLKALDCYEYQSCEHEGWPASEAFRFCDALRRALIGHIPGYREAAWEVRSPVSS